MDYRNRILILSVVITLLFTISGVCAGELNDTAVTATDVEINDDLVESAHDKSIQNSADGYEDVLDASQVKKTGAGEMGDFNSLQNLINNANESDVITLNHSYTFTPTLDDNITEGIIIDKALTIDGNGYTIDAAGIAKIFDVRSEHVKLTNITFINCNRNMSNFKECIINWNGDWGSIVNCNFINNSHIKGYLIKWGSSNGFIVNCSFLNYSSNDGIIIDIAGSGNLFSNCSFINCSSNESYILHVAKSNNLFSNCSFLNCSSKSANIYIAGSSILFSNCSFLNCSSNTCVIYNDGSSNSFSNCSFLNCSAPHGPIIYSYDSHGSFFNCSFVNCLGGRGGAIFIFNEGSVSNCTFINCFSQNNDGGGVNAVDGISITGCSFINCSATRGGGGVWMYENGNTVFNCSFINCSAYQGGAIYANDGRNTVYNCSFMNCSASEFGGAIYWKVKYGSVSNCDFVNNSAEKRGGAIFWHYITTSWDGQNIYGDSLCYIDHCNFVNNSANSGSAIYSMAPHQISNSTFKYNKVHSVLKCSDDNKNGMLNFAFEGGNRYINAIYSTKNIDFYNVTYYYNGSMVNSDIVPIVSTPDTFENLNLTVEIYCRDILVDNVTLKTDDAGKISYPYFKLSKGNYTYRVYYTSDYIYCESRGNFSEAPMVNFNDLQKVINIYAEGDIINLESNITFTDGVDDNLTAGIVINKNLTINGNGYTIDAAGKAGIFNVLGNGVKLTNITFINVNLDAKDQNAINWKGIEGAIVDCKFINTSVTSYLINWIGKNGSMVNCSFLNASSDKISVLWKGTRGFIFNCSFMNCEKSSCVLCMNYDGGDNSTVSCCSFVNCFGKEYGALAWASNGGFLFNCSFVNCSGNHGGALGWGGNGGFILNCSFINCFSRYYDGVVYWTSSNGNISGCSFVNCSSARHGGAIYLSGNRNANIYNCSFVNSSAVRYGGAIYLDNSRNTHIYKCSFIGNAADLGSAIYSDYEFYLHDSIFLFNKILDGLYPNDNKDIGVLSFKFDTGRNNYFDAFHVKNEFSHSSYFRNITYSYNMSILNTNDVPIVRNNNFTFSGLDLIVEVYSGNNLVDNVTVKSDKAYTAYYDYTHLEDGNYTYKAYHPNTGQTYREVKGNFISKHIKTNVTITVSNVSYGDYPVVNLTSDVEGNYSLIVAGKDYGIYELNQSNNFTILISLNDLLNAGNGYVASVEFGGFSVYAPASANTTFNVYQTLSNFNASSALSEYTYGENITFIVEFPGDASGNVVFYYLNSTVGMIENISQQKSLNIKVLDVNTYTILAKYSGDVNYKNSTREFIFTVKPADNIVKVSADSVQYPGEVNVRVNATLDGVYVVDIKGTKYNIAANGAGISLKLAAGTYFANILNGSDINHIFITTNTSFTVSKAKNPVEVIVEDKILPGDTKIKVNALVDGIYTVVINETYTVDVNVSGGSGNASIDLSAGKLYTATTSFTHENYTSEIINATFNVLKAINTINVIAESVIYPDLVNIRVNATIDGVYVVDINGTKYNVTANGEGISLKLAAGNYYVGVFNYSSPYYEGVIKNMTFTVRKAQTTVEGKVEDIIYSQDVIVNVKGSVDGIVVVAIDGRDIASVNVISNNFTSVTFKNISAGKHNVTITLNPGDANYSKSTFNTNFTVSKKPTNVSLHVSNVIWPKNAIINVSASENGIVTINIGDLVKKVNVTGNVSESVDIGLLDIGLYNVIASFTAGDNYTDSQTFKSFRVLLQIKDSDLNITVPEIIAGNKSNITVNLPVDVSGNITLIIANNTIISEVIDGVSNIIIPPLTDGEYNYIIIYSGDDKYAPFEKSDSIEVAKPTPEIIIPPLDEISNGKDITVNLPDDATGNLTVSILNQVFTQEVINGSATIKVTNLPVGKHTITIIYSGDKKYAESIQNTTITVVVAPRIVMGLSEVLYTGDYSIILYGKDAKVCANADVIFYINGKMVKTTKTDSNGVAVFKLPKTCVSKKYNIQVSSLGQVAFKILKIKHILTIKSVKVKKSAKKLILKAALKKLNGKYLKGKKITLKIKGKKVASAKTNKKGVVTFKVKNKKLKKFKKGKKYKVTVSYAKDVVSKKIKIVK